jgi:hypothetical protein
MTQAEWLQEDVLNGRSRRLFPYPRLSPITVGNLEVDGAPPTTARLLLMTGHMQLTVSPVLNDAFTLQATTYSH